MAHPLAGTSRTSLVDYDRDRVGTVIRPAAARRRAAAKSRPRIKVRFGRLLLVLSVAYGFFLFGTQEFRMYQLKVQEHRVQGEIDRLRRENQDLGEQIKFMQSDEYVEKVAREQLGLVKDGEIPYYNGTPGDPGKIKNGSGY
ncbi:MAG TPA: septum formation initiator family protein [Bacillota bacterium]